ncbi:hypothetical protein FQA47_002199 [Oryzias melastigma]|uniref:Uncharacterized protein n=1 Tax=Oryzias melastigma TaxID=30732 RepID=A0A834C2I1_ORYME|nr:hypothetical protein FQA47_002199 [Oryzias melastigma]
MFFLPLEPGTTCPTNRYRSVPGALGLFCYHTCLSFFKRVPSLYIHSKSTAIKSERQLFASQRSSFSFGMYFLRVRGQTERWHYDCSSPKKGEAKIQTPQR